MATVNKPESQKPDRPFDIGEFVIDCRIRRLVKSRIVEKISKTYEEALAEAERLMQERKKP